ncbi:MAG: polyprenyl synthetase family protein [Spirochaetia bacterium]|nr:polyprenyl synthetase family protein [Spirochaetia bacterium]
MSPDGISRLKQEFDEFLGTTVRELFSSGTVPFLVEPVNYSLTAPGKRLRPMLCMMFANYRGPSDSSILFAAAAVECIHTYSLVHDDLPAMDNDDLRRGRLTCHKAYSEWAAILAGDALNTFAFELLAEANFAGAGLSDAIRILARAGGRTGMVSGQALDLENERGRGQALANKHEILGQIHLRKTAALIAASCELGALISGLNRELVSDFGTKLGLLFQITDDLLDAHGSKDAGKATGKDAAAGKLTYPAVFGLKEAERICDELTQDTLTALGKTGLTESVKSYSHALERLTVELKDRSR